jgi:hypothetical protein
MIHIKVVPLILMSVALMFEWPGNVSRNFLENESSRRLALLSLAYNYTNLIWFFKT